MKSMKLIVCVLGLSLCSMANAGTFKYVCFPYNLNPGGFDVKINLTVSGNKATVEYADGSYKSTGTLDPAYKPKTSSDKVQFVGFDNDGDYSVTVLLEKTLLEGGRTLQRGGTGGILTIRAKWEDFQTGSYVCMK